MSLDRLLCLTFISLFICGCQSTSPKKEIKPNTGASQSEKPANYQQHVRNNAASLLYDLLNDEKNLSKILIIKSESDALHDLVKQISETARVHAEQLDHLAATDSSLNLHTMGLPSGEAATREAVSKTKEHELLHSKGEEFEFKLLLTQTEALNYGSHLAKVAAANDPDTENAKTFTAIQSDLEALYEKVCKQLQHR